MKTPRFYSRKTFSAFCLASLLLPVSPAPARSNHDAPPPSEAKRLPSLGKLNSPPAPKTIINQFDDETEAEAWTATWGTSPVLSFDPQNSAGGPNSGSLKVSADYFTPADDGWEQMVITRRFDPPIAGADHVSVSVDIKVDASSVPSSGGNYGYFEFKRTDGSALGGVNLTSAEWTSITFNIPPTEADLAGIIVQNGNGGFQGPVSYYLDNLVFTQKSSGGPPPPSLTITPHRTPGLKLFASAPGQAFQRQNIVFAPSEVLDNALWWVNQPAPMTYSITWGEFPSGPANIGFQGHVILASDTTGGNTPDWNDANVILVEFQYANHPGPDSQTGTPDDAVLARARFLHKVNEPANNAMLYRTQANANAGPVGVLGEIWAPSMLGSWTISFLNNTDIKLTAPDNSTVALTMPDSDFPFYEPAAAGVSAQFGVQPNSDARIGLSAILSRVKIQKGAAVVVDETFPSAELNPERWLVRAANPAGIFPAPGDLAYLVSWNLPDTGFALRSAPAITGPWTNPGEPLLVGARRVMRIHHNALPSPASGFFQLIGPSK